MKTNPAIELRPELKRNYAGGKPNKQANSLIKP